MNKLRVVRPELYREIQEEGTVDCFYRDELLYAAIAYITENWGRPIRS